VPASDVRLVCPLCGGLASAGAPPPAAAACPGCGARYAGDGESAREAVARGLEGLDIVGLEPDEVTSALFSVPPERCRELGVAIASDEREGFYRWWLFVAAGGEARERLHALLAEFRK
jgi:hypothetical protein